MYSIRAINISKRFGNVVAVDEVSFDVKKGEIFGFLGPNGAGKTTTIRMLTGVLVPDSGDVEIEGIDMLNNSIDAKMRIGVIPEIGNVYVDLSPRQNLALAGKFYGLPKADIEKRSDEILASLGLKERKNDPVRTFSKGMRQRVSIACAILHEPDLLFLDEPTEGLDVQSRRMIVDTINGLNARGSTIFLTTHNIEEANRLCGRVGIINKGRMVALDSPEKLKRTFDKTRSIEISFDRDAKCEVFESDNVSKITVFGDKIRLYTNDPDGTIKEVVDKARKEDLKIVSMNVCGPSLEEAFVKLTEAV